MRRWLAFQMSRPWIARIGTLCIFLAAMYGVRTALIALRDTHDTVLVLSVCIPVTLAGIAFAFWLERRGH